jgi:hypothetical protein
LAKDWLARSIDADVTISNTGKAADHAAQLAAIIRQRDRRGRLVANPSIRAALLSARDAASRSLDLLGAADLGVVAADHSLDLAGRTAAIVDKNDLAFAQRAHRRLLLQGCGKGQTSKVQYEKSG